jgi:hypothetical protein
MSTNYEVARDTFTKMVMDQKCNGDASCGYLKQGRKFDKLFLTKDGKSSVEFFINRNTGMIFGAKSNTIFNPNRRFGTVYNASKWSWSGKGGKNVSDTTMTQTGHYAGYAHYTPVDELTAEQKAALEGKKEVVVA